MLIKVFTSLLLSVLILPIGLMAKDSSIKYKKKKFPIDKKSKNRKQNIKLKTGKTSDRRAYNGTVHQEVDAPIENILSAVLDFENRCNNEMKDKRKYHSKKKKCKYFNGNLVESKIIRSDKLKPNKEQNIKDQFIIIRNIYNRYAFTHADLITVFEEIHQDKKRYRVKIEMMDDRKTKKYLKNKIERTSAFLNIEGEFVLDQISPNKTSISYSYVSVTDHWLLNKSVSAGTVMEKMESSFITLFSNIKIEASTAFVAKNSK
ncbi:hypothetical protein N9N67_04760 [Bacteriovoracaceae bacterium]|nr:hypothetical protein [Bacteriovoracaceae bacterium]